jgi:hypothetical protein
MTTATRRSDRGDRRCVLGTVLLLGLRLTAAAETRYVSLAGGDVSPYTNWLTAATTIQAAVDASIAGDFIWVTDGVYRVGARVTPGGSLSNRVVITNDITLQSVNGRDFTAIEGAGPLGSNPVRCVYLGAGTLRGFTLTNGFTGTAGNQMLDRSGGAALAPTGRLQECRLTGSAASDYGGGVSGGVLERCLLARNSATRGGGAHAAALQSCAVWGNAASVEGGGLSSCSATNCTVVDNTAAAGGGTLSSTLRNCIVFHNLAPLMPNTYYGQAENCVTWPHGSKTRGCVTNIPRLLSFLHVAPDSPCVGKGWPAAGLPGDADGEAWADPPAIGCDEPHAESATGSLRVAIRLETTQAVAGASVRLVAVTEGVPRSNVWMFGDGRFETNTAFVTHAWETAGSFTLTVAVYNVSQPGGVTATARMVILSAEGTAKYVRTNSPLPAPPFNSWSNAAHTIQEAVDQQTLFGGWVWVDDGTYDTGTRVTPSGVTPNRVVITNNVRVRSVNGPVAARIVGQKAWPVSSRVRCAYLSAGRLEGFTLMDGGTYSGVGGYDLNLCGGGVNAPGGVLSNCLLVGNTAAGDGGGANFGVFYNCTFSNNSAVSFSGAADWGVLFDCVVISNRCTGTGISRGGGLGGGSAYNSVLIGNVASMDGHGAWGAGSLHHCLVARHGGQGTLGFDLYNCTVVFNGTGAVDANSVNTILYYNGLNVSGGTNLFCCLPVDPGGTGNRTNAPLFIDPTMGHYRLQYLSPCIDAGTNGPWTTGTTDLDGQPRVVGGTVDIGAYEMPADSDGDGLSDPWEQHYAGGLTNLWAGGDWDGDGSLDEQEMRAGTDPADAASVLRLVAADVQPDGAGVIVQWASEPGRVYSLRGASDAVAGLPGVLQSNLTAVAPVNVFTAAAPDAVHFFSVQLQTP